MVWLRSHTKLWHLVHRDSILAAAAQNISRWLTHSVLHSPKLSLTSLLHRAVTLVVCCRQSQSPAWVGGFGSPAPSQPGPVMPNQGNFNMAGYQTQWSGSHSHQWESVDFQLGEHKVINIVIIWRDCVFKAEKIRNNNSLPLLRKQMLFIKTGRELFLLAEVVLCTN